LVTSRVLKKRTKTHCHCDQFRYLLKRMTKGHKTKNPLVRLVEMSKAKRKNVESWTNPENKKTQIKDLQWVFFFVNIS